MAKKTSELPDIDSLHRSFLTRFQQRGGVEGTDFRPHWDGFLVNCCVTIVPLRTQQTTVSLIYSELAGMIRFVAEHVSLFARGDRVQFVVGWDESVRTTGRQILKRWIEAHDAPRLDVSPTSLEADSPLYPGWCRATFSEDDRTPQP